MKFIIISLIAISQLFSANHLPESKPFGRTLICVIINGDEYCILVESSFQDMPDRLKIDGKLDFSTHMMTFSNFPKTWNNQSISLLKEGSNLSLKMDDGTKNCQLTTGKYTIKNNQLLIPFKVDK
ncbi:MAG: hypothetical protein KDC59_00360 [Saprospiraceae bacterium]|nr:hypothetical protein [Saprospiraceae bacterium]HPG05360.1 hypothetical protein [Saprospiraceae bacterium]